MYTKKYHLHSIRKRKRRIALATIGLMGASFVSFIAVFHAPTRAALFDGRPSSLTIGVGFLMVGLAIFISLTSIARHKPSS